MATGVTDLITGAYRKLALWLDSVERAQEEAVPPVGRLARGVLPVAEFLGRLVEETDRSERYGLEYGLLVFHLPTTPAASRRKLELALRRSLRKSDIAGRLSETALAVILPEKSGGSAAAAERIARLLAEVAEGPVSGGFACYPAEGEKSSDLMRIAAMQSGAFLASPPPLAGAE